MKLKQISMTFFVLCIIFGTSCKKDDTFNPVTGKNLTFEHAGLTRSYHLYTPDNLPANAPLIFVLHGYTSNNDKSYDYGFNEIADTAGFAVCYPLGAKDDLVLFNHWNAKLNISSVNDIGFLTELAQYLQSEHGFNIDRTFCCGFSNGGFMSYTLGCESPNVFKAIAPVSGLMSGYTWDNRNIASAIPVLHIHGTDDGVIPTDGSMPTAGGWGGAPPVAEIVDYWADLNNCTAPETVIISANTTAHYHRNGTGGNEVWYYSITNHGHTWPGTLFDDTGIEACKVIWEFFSKF